MEPDKIGLIVGLAMFLVAWLVVAGAMWGKGDSWYLKLYKRVDPRIIFFVFLIAGICAIGAGGTISAKQERMEIYAAGEAYAENGDYVSALQEFIRIKDWRDTNTRIAECIREIERLQEEAKA